MALATVNVKNSALLEILLGFRIILNFVPASQEYIPAIINAISVFAIWLLLLSQDPAYVGKKIVQFVPLYLITLANLLWGYKSTSLPMFVYGLLQWFIFPVGVSILIDSKQTQSIKRLLLFSLLCITITSITTYLGNEVYPGASRALAAIWNDDSMQVSIYRRMNIGGFEFIYLLTLLFPLSVYVLKSVKLSRKIYIVIVLAIAMASIYKSEYTTALLMAILGIAACILPKGITSKRLAFFLIVISIIAVLTATALSNFVDSVSNNIESRIIAERLRGVSDVLSGKQVEGDTENRIELMKQSWQCFLANPIFGSSNVGGHSYILDVLGKFGVFGAFLLWLTFRSLFHLFIRPFKNQPFYSILLITFLFQIVLCVMNTQIIESLFFIFIPLSSYMLYSNQKF